jgi:hypothetical protein
MTRKLPLILFILLGLVLLSAPAYASVSPERAQGPHSIPLREETLVFSGTGTWTDSNANGVADAGEPVVYNYTLVNTYAEPAVLVGVGMMDIGVDIHCVPVANYTPMAPGATVTCTSDPYFLTSDDVAQATTSSFASAQFTIASDPFQKLVYSGVIVNLPFALNAETCEGVLNGTVQNQDALLTCLLGGEVIVSSNVVIKPATAIETLPGSSLNVGNGGHTDNSGIVNVGGGLINNGGSSGPSGPTGRAAPAAAASSVPGFINRPGGALNVWSGGWVNNNTSIDNYGSIHVFSGGILNNYGTIASSGSILNEGTIHNHCGASISSTGTWQGAQALTTCLTVDLSASPATYSNVGDIINWSYLVANVDEPAATSIEIADSLGTSISCPQTYLMPGESMTCTGTHTIAQVDLDAGQVSNTAEARIGSIVYDQDTDSVVAVVPALSLTKTANPATYTYPGDVIVYTYVAKNTGNVALDGPFTISDDKLGAFQCGTATGLAANATVTCTKNYTIQAADVNASGTGSITNHATVAGAYQGAAVTSAQASATITQVAPAGRIAAFGATCGQFLAGTAADVNSVTYTVRNGKVYTVSPTGVSYYSKITAPAASFTVVVQQAAPTGWTPFGLQAYGWTVYDAACKARAVTGMVGATAVTFKVTNATPGAVHVVGLKYRADTLAYRQSVTSPYPTVTYVVTSAVNGTLVPTSWDSVNMKPQ